MSIFDKIARVFGKVEQAKIALDVLKTSVEGMKKFPPLMLCPICSGRTKWIDQGHVWGCDKGHRFSVEFHASGPPDKLAKDYEGEI